MLEPFTARIPQDDVVTGHCSAYTSPDQLAADIRRFFLPLRPSVTTKEI